MFYWAPNPKSIIQFITSSPVRNIFHFRVNLTNVISTSNLVVKGYNKNLFYKKIVQNCIVTNRTNFHHHFNFNFTLGKTYQLRRIHSEIWKRVTDVLTVSVVINKWSEFKTVPRRRRSLLKSINRLLN